MYLFYILLVTLALIISLIFLFHILEYRNDYDIHCKSWKYIKCVYLLSGFFNLLLISVKNSTKFPNM